jgi:meiotically up-regulated gene 157 (Mug157) protein
VKAFMTKVQGKDNMEKVFVMVITKFLETIIQDPYGNYVVQHAYEIYK